MDENRISYEKDFYEWAIHNANLMRQRRLSEIDFENIAEELESMGRSEQRELENRLIVLIAHLLKWHFQPEHRSGSWLGTINEQRKRIHKLLKTNPSLKLQMEEKVAEIYDIAISRAFKDTGIPEAEFPRLCPYKENQILDSHFYPDRWV